MIIVSWPAIYDLRLNFVITQARAAQQHGRAARQRRADEAVFVRTVRQQSAVLGQALAGTAELRARMAAMVWVIVITNDVDMYDDDSSPSTTHQEPVSRTLIVVTVLLYSDEG